MNFLNRILALACAACIVLFTVQCEIIDTDLLNDPNNPSPENVNPDFLLNSIQFDGRNVYAGAASLGAQLTRMRYMFGETYADAFSSGSFNGIYGNAYNDLFIDTENLTGIAQERQLFFHLGIAKTLKAYAMITLVDVFGDMPLSEALDASNFNPGLDGAAAIYDSALVLLDSAIDDLTNQDRRGFPEQDLYYGELDDEVAQEAAWVRAANTIKLKAHLNMGNTAEVQALIDGGNLITNAADNFTFQWGTVDTNPDSRHPSFAGNYVDQANDYMALSYMNNLLNDKPEIDPRMRYYFYRQTTSDPTDINENTCLAANVPGHFDSDDPFCYPENNGDDDGWWGRDHMINDGIPPDGDLRTTWGVYPVGGEFDTGQGVSTEPDMGYQGAGFDPILMAAYTQFMIAEHENNQGNTGPAKTALDAAINQSFDTVSDFGSDAADGSGFAMTAADRTDHTDEVDSRWTAAAGDSDAQQNIISMEYYLALWPNGLEAYNLMRRTGAPNRADNNLQPARSPNPGPWYNSFLYPSNMVERNSSIDQKDRTETTFWDDASNYNFDF